MLLGSGMKFLETPPRFVFFTGKGGVGKTSVACAAALHLAGRGQRVLLVSTDPASNVGQVLGLTIGNIITPVDQGIHPWAWVINNSIAAARPEAPFLRLRAASEAGQIERVSALTDRIALVPLQATEPTGEGDLAALTALTHQPA